MHASDGQMPIIQNHTIQNRHYTEYTPEKADKQQRIGVVSYYTVYPIYAASATRKYLFSALPKNILKKANFFHFRSLQIENHVL